MTRLSLKAKADQQIPASSRVCKTEIATIISSLQIAMGAFVSFFFSGFILGKVPFPLSPSFRIMLQVLPSTALIHLQQAADLNASMCCSF